MKLIAETTMLKKTLEKAWDFSGKKSAMSVTGMFYLKAKGDKLEIRATDMKSGMITRIPAEVEEEGELLVSAEKLKDTINNSTAYEKIVMSTEKDRLAIRNIGTKKFQMNLRMTDASRFPEMETSASVEYAAFPQSEFLLMADKASPMVSKDTSRIFLTGVYMVKEGSKLVMAATDGKRLAKMVRDGNGLPDFDGAIIPVTFLKALKKAIPGEGLMEFAVKNGHLHVKLDDMFLYTTLLQGNFPAYNRVIPTSFKAEAVLDTKDMKAALGIIENASDTVEKRKAILTFRENGCSFESISDDDEGSYELETEYSGEPIAIVLSDKLLASIVEKVPDDRFRFAMNTPTSAVKITWDSDPQALYIMMPMNN